jgi:hypothetical protein
MIAKINAHIQKVLNKKNIILCKCTDDEFLGYKDCTYKIMYKTNDASAPLITSTVHLCHRTNKEDVSPFSERPCPSPQHGSMYGNCIKRIERQRKREGVVPLTPSQLMGGGGGGPKKDDIKNSGPHTIYSLDDQCA